MENARSSHFLERHHRKNGAPVISTAVRTLAYPCSSLKRYAPAFLNSDAANFEELSQFLYPIGLYNTRAKRLIEFSTMWLTNPPCPDVLTKRKGLAKYPPTSISHLPGASLSLGHVDDRWVYMHLIHGECFVQVSMNGGTFSRWTKSYKHGWDGDGIAKEKPTTIHEESKNDAYRIFVQC